MSPRANLVLCGSGQLTGSQKTQSAMSPVDLEGHPVDRVNYRHFHKHLAGEGILRGPVDRVHWILYPDVVFCSQLRGSSLCARSTSWVTRSAGYTKSLFSEFCPFHFPSKSIKSSPNLH
eukprot:TRINITY_DN23627_c0_g1_i8.p1 TRINITY_DN23627_c0_g1~~TRINITY_DN23627_c0_g1_i8.p1  ORF type:complete len:119 (+),score=6.29 TRINITY_DN23627_c0_g1_i8:224-580(+)